MKVTLEKIEGFANAFTVQQPDWIQLAPFGDFAHARGLQRVDAIAAAAMVKQFRSFIAKVGRSFGGLPFYIGHPDAPGLRDQFADNQAYGWIMDLESRADGLYAHTKWSARGRDLVENAHYKYVSPYWEAEEVAPGVYRPVRLISAGLTNQPNLPVLPLTNSEDAEPEPAADCAAITLLLDNCVLDGRIQPWERARWTNLLRANFEARSAALERLAPRLSNTPVSHGIARRKLALGNYAQRQARVQELIREQTERGLDYDAAWNAVKEEHPALFQMMHNHHA